MGLVSTSPQSPSPLRPTRWLSRCTLVVSSPPDAEPSLTTVSSPSDTEAMLAKTHHRQELLGCFMGRPGIHQDRTKPVRYPQRRLLPSCMSGFSGLITIILKCLTFYLIDLSYI